VSQRFYGGAVMELATIEVREKGSQPFRKKILVLTKIGKVRAHCETS